MQSLEIPCSPEQILLDLTQILCRIITSSSSGSRVALCLDLPADTHGRVLRVRVTHRGSGLPDFEAITSGLRLPVEIDPLAEGGALFEISLPTGLRAAPAPDLEEPLSPPPCTAEYAIPIFYKKLRKHLQAYTTSMKSLEESVAKEHGQQEQAFLKKVNAAIIAGVAQEDFDVTALCKTMALSRSQLYRRLKPLIRLSPSQYIRFIRLHKAREFLERGEMTVGEVAFQVGFVDHSHFTRVFCKQFGFHPSYLRKARNKLTSHE